MKKSLLDIQQEIRRVEDVLRSATLSISKLNHEIGDLRDESFVEYDYNAIRLLAKHFSFDKHPLSTIESMYVRKLYIRCLLSIVRTDFGSESTYNRLIFVQWIISQAELDVSLEDLLNDSMQCSIEMFGELAEIIPQHLFSQLVVDAMLVANVDGAGNSEIIQFVADLCVIFGVDKKQLYIYTIITKWILCGKLRRIEDPEIYGDLCNHVTQFSHYINDEMVREGMSVQRVLAVVAPDRTFYRFEWKVKPQAYVKKGEVIARYQKSLIGSNNPEYITAPLSGTIYYFRDKNINYGVISHANDDRNSVKSWALKVQGGR